MTPLSTRSPRAYRLSRISVAYVRDERTVSSREPSRSHVALHRVIAPDVVRPLVADRAESYVAILHALLAMRREGDDAPALEELRRRMHVLDADEAAFLRDLLQLEAWGCLRRELEPSRVRGYADARRDRFRHRLAEDAAALLAWLESRARDRATEWTNDAGEQFADLIARVAELSGLDPEADARRGAHLVRTIESELEAIERSLVGLDGELRSFAERRFDADALDRIVIGLEGFLREHVAPVDRGRAALEAAIDRLQTGIAPADTVRGWRVRVATGGTLDRLARRIEASTRAAIAMLRRHVHATVEDGRTSSSFDRAMRALAEHDGDVEGLRLWGHRPPIAAPGPGDRLAPPLPRRRARAARGAPAPIDAKGTDVARPRRATEPERRRELARAWLSSIGPGAGDGAVLSHLPRAVRGGPEAIDAWMAIARARHLGRGRGLSAWGLRIEARDGLVRLGDDTRGLVTADCVLYANGAAR